MHAKWNVFVNYFFAMSDVMSSRTLRSMPPQNLHENKSTSTTYAHTLGVFVASIEIKSIESTGLLNYR